MPPCSTTPSNHPWCSPPKFSPQQCWRCLSPLDPYKDDFGDLDLHGRDIGCKPCEDIPTFWFDHWPVTDGLRFLGKPSDGFVRDAMGRVGDVMSWAPLKFVRKLELRRAGGYRYNNKLHTECFGADACDFSMKINSPFLPGGCDVPGFFPVQLGERLNGNFPDCFAYHGALDNAQGANSQMYIRNVLDGSSEAVNASTSVPWHNTSVHVFGDRDSTPCVVNMLALCTSDVFQGSICNSALYNNDLWSAGMVGGERIPPETYLYGSNRVVIDFFRTIGIKDPPDIRLNANPANKWIDRPTALAKTKVLEYAVATHGRTEGFVDFFGVRHKMDQLLSDDFRFYRRTWITPQVPCIALAGGEQTVPDVFGVCATGRHRGARLTVAFVLTFIEISADILVLRQRRQNFDGKPTHGEATALHNRYGLYPHVGVEVRCHGVPVVTAAEGLPEGWRVANGAECRGRWASGQPKVLSPDGMPQVLDERGRHADEILYRDSLGRSITSFFEAVWIGHLNDFSRPRTHNIVETWTDRTWPFSPINQGTAHGCGSLAEAFDGVLVPGYAVHEQSNANDPAQLFHGGLNLTFREGAYLEHGG